MRVSVGQHPSVHRAAFFLEDPFPSLSWFLCGLIPWLGSFFFNNSTSSDHSSSLTFPSDWNWKGCPFLRIVQLRCLNWGLNIPRSLSLLHL